MPKLDFDTVSKMWFLSLEEQNLLLRIDQPGFSFDSVEQSSSNRQSSIHRIMKQLKAHGLIRQGRKDVGYGGFTWNTEVVWPNENIERKMSEGWIFIVQNEEKRTTKIGMRHGQDFLHSRALRGVEHPKIVLCLQVHSIDHVYTEVLSICQPRHVENDLYYLNNADLKWLKTFCEGYLAKESPSRQINR